MPQIEGLTVKEAIRKFGKDEMLQKHIWPTPKDKDPRYPRKWLFTILNSLDSTREKFRGWVRECWDNQEATYQAQKRKAAAMNKEYSGFFNASHQIAHGKGHQAFKHTVKNIAGQKRKLREGAEVLAQEEIGSLARKYRRLENDLPHQGQGVSRYINGIHEQIGELTMRQGMLEEYVMKLQEASTKNLELPVYGDVVSSVPEPERQPSVLGRRNEESMQK